MDTSVILPYQRKRAEHSKSAGGCGTCKTRHLKCDETKPVCDRCRRSGRECSGYVAGATLARINKPRKRCHKGFRFVNNGMVLIQNDKVAAVVPPPSPLSLVKADEKLNIVDFFFTTAIPALESGSPAGFLSDLNRSNIFANEVLSNAATALTFQYLVVARNKLTDQNPSNHFLVSSSMQAYARTIQSFRASLGRPSFDTLAMVQASLLLLMVEALRKNPEAAQAHLMGAISLLESFNFESHPAEFKESWMRLLRTCVIRSISIILHRIDMRMIRSVKKFVAMKQAIEPAPSPDFSQICRTIDGLVIEVFDFVARPFAAYENDFSTAEARQARLLDALAAVKQDLSELSASSGEANYQASRLLKARVTMCEIFLNCCLTSYQTTYDAYHDQFVEILDLIEDALQERRSRLTDANTNSLRWTFSPEFGVIPTLYKVVQQCRFPDIRRRAITLMRLCPARDGLWNTADTIDISLALMDFEELGLNPVDPTKRRKYIPEECRAHNVWFNKSPPDSEGRVQKYLDILWRPRATVLGLSTIRVELTP